MNFPDCMVARAIFLPPPSERMRVRRSAGDPGRGVGRGEEEGDESRRTTPLSLAFVTLRRRRSGAAGSARAAVNESNDITISSLHTNLCTNLA